MIEINGSEGEGGGQILRTCLSLAMCTGQGIRIVNIRAKRSKPGLLRQHLTAVNAAAEVCGATVSGATLGSTTLQFVPGSIRAGQFQFSIGTAGSCTLVLQTVLPALLHAPACSTVVLQGGTHNPFAPPFHFLERTFLPLLVRMGVRAGLTLKKFGFYPAGGGEVVAEIDPIANWQRLHLPERGKRIGAYAESFVAGLPAHVARRELEEVGKAMAWSQDQLREHLLPRNQGPGNALMVTCEYEHVTEVFTAFGEKGVSAEAVAQRAVAEARPYLASEAAVGEHLADQLLLPMALAGGGSFTALTPSQHFVTNAEVIGRFLPIRISTQKLRHDVYRVEVASA